MAYELNEPETILKLKEEQHFALSKISHEIRNPVTLINSFLQLIQEQHPEVKEFQYWSETMENMEFLKSLLYELSDYNNSQKLHLQEANIYKLLHSMTQSLQPSLDPYHISILLIKESAIPLLSLDITKMREAFLNLIRNSREAIGSDGIIKIFLSSDGEQISIRLCDDGPGIPADYIPTLFDAFVTHKKDGTGLGLAITKNVIEAHGGSICVSSKPDTGTEFSISLPV